MKNTSINSGYPPKRIAPLAYSLMLLLAVAAWPLLRSSAMTLPNAWMSTLKVLAFGLVPIQGQTSTYSLHGTGPVANPPTLFLNTTAPTAISEKYKDSASINRNGGNPWKEVGSWPATPQMVSGSLASLGDVHVYLGLKNSDDQGTYFDLRVEAYKNSTLVASGQSLCITGVTRNPAAAKEVVLGFDPFSATPFNGSSDVLTFKVLTRVGTNEAGNSCGGHNNAIGLRLYFDAVSRNSRFSATTGSSDTTPPVLTVGQPPDNLIISATQITVTGTFNDQSPTSIVVNGVSAAVQGNSFSATVPLSEGPNQLVIVATDAAGNSATVTRNVVRDTTPPTVAIGQPTAGTITNSSQITVSGTFNDATATTIKVNNTDAAIAGNTFSVTVPIIEGTNGLNVVALDLAGNQTQVLRNITRDSIAPTVSVSEPVNELLTNVTQLEVKGTYSDASSTAITVNGTIATLSGGNFSVTVELNEGENTLNVVAVDAAGNQSETSRSVTRDRTPPLLTVDQPAAGAVVDKPLLSISGTFSDPHKTTITINDDLKSFPKMVGNQFTALLELTEGSNTITVRGSDRAGNQTEVVRTVVYHIDHTPPVLTLLEPAAGAFLKTVIVRGSVTTVNPPVTVSANGHPLSLEPNGTFSGGLSLVEGANEVHVTAIDANHNETNIMRPVTVDTIAPEISELTPTAGALIDSTHVSIHGRITDLAPVSVSVNGVTASVDSGGLFVAQNVPIAEGESQFVIRATDAAGNASRSTLLLIGKDNTPPAAPQVLAAITPTRLNFQTIEGRAEPGSQVTISGGAELKTIDAAYGTGLFAAVINLTPGTSVLTIIARDRSGNVSPPTQLSITSDAGMALPAPGQPAQINISSGSAQRGLVNTELPRPVIAIVTDRTGAPVMGVVVNFALTQGSGAFVNGTTTIAATTDAYGKATARYINGAVSGIQLIRANYTGNTSTPATFTAEAIDAPVNGITTVSGIVQDQNLRALPNVLVRVGGQETRTGVDGRFAFTNVTSGPHQLLELIGRDQITLPGRWPNISYDFDVLPGIDNDLGRPLFLPKVNDGVAMPLDSNNVVTQDTTFELPVVGGEPPVRVTAKAGTHIIFPPDVTDKRLSVTRLATNRTPMVLEDGRATNLYISVQPSGAIFETPLQVSFPNLDHLPAGQEVLLMSFDHDVGRYVKVGTGHVSADGRVVSSDAGSGIRVGAWHALPPDPPQAEVTVLGHIQFEGNPAFTDRLVKVNEAWVEGERAVLMTSNSSAPRWDYRATLSVPGDSVRLAKMEAAVVTSVLDIDLDPPVAPEQALRAGSVKVPAQNAQSSGLQIVISPGQSVEYGATGSPAPESGETYSYSWSSDDTSIATVDFIAGANNQTHPTKANIKGVAPGKTTVTVTYSIKCRSCWIFRSAEKDVDVTVLGVTSLEAELQSTKNAATGATPAPGRFPTTLKDLAFEPSVASDLMVVMQNSGPITIKAIGISPTSATSKIRWQVERNPGDTVASGLPDFSDNEAGQFTVTPNTPGNFRIVCYVNTYDNNTRYEGQELKVLRLAIVRVTLQSGTIASYAEFSGQVVSSVTIADRLVLSTSPGLSSPPHFTMEMDAVLLLEGGGQNRMIGVNQVVLGDVGNMILDTILVTYPIPNPAPPAPGNVEGTMREIPGAQMPLVDGPNAAPAGGEDPIRSNSNTQVLGNGPNGGQLRSLSSLDEPGFGWLVKHPTTGNNWASIRGVNAFREAIVGFSQSFKGSYVVVATGDWTVVADGINSQGNWVGQGAKVLVQGTTNQSRPLSALTQQAADAAGLQVHGPSANSVVNGTGGLLYQP